MPPQGKDDKRHHNSSTSTSKASSVSWPLTPIPLPELPEDIIVYILKRLPVKSILRFKCVSKEWLCLLSSPNFISMHREETSNNPLNHSFIIHTVDERYDYHEMSQLSQPNINSNPWKSMSLLNWDTAFFPSHFSEVELVGSINGLVCLSFCFGSLRRMAVLWNPARNLYKHVGLCIPNEEKYMISLGFAYDSANDDYNIIQIPRLYKESSSPDAHLRSSAHVYSAKLDSWKRVEIGFPCFISSTRDQSNVIAKGILYWTSSIYQENNQSALLSYDTRNGSFNHVLLPKLVAHDKIDPRFVEWKGNLGVIVSGPSDRDYLVDILVYDEMGMCWNKISSHGPIGLDVNRYIQCSTDGVILADTRDETLKSLMLYDSRTNRMKGLCILGFYEFSVNALSYTESLVTIKGMKQVKEEKKHKYLVGLEDLDDDNDDMLFSSLPFFSFLKLD